MWRSAISGDYFVTGLADSRRPSNILLIFHRNRVKERAMKKALKACLRSPPLRWPLLGLGKLSSWASRAFSLVLASYYFPRAYDLVCHWSVRVKYPERVAMGRDVVIGPHAIIGAHGRIVFGDRVRISEGVVIETAGLDFSGKPPYPHISRPIELGEGVWIGTKAIILGGVKIGAGAIIGAGAVVTRDVPERAVYAGFRQPRATDVREDRPGA
jgi:acetyltransferase-like isoleucine patch superfamily enzyme